MAHRVAFVGIDNHSPILHERAGRSRNPQPHGSFKVFSQPIAVSRVKPVFAHLTSQHLSVAGLLGKEYDDPYVRLQGYEVQIDRFQSNDRGGEKGDEEFYVAFQNAPLSPLQALRSPVDRPYLYLSRLQRSNAFTSRVCFADPIRPELEEGMSFGDLRVFAGSSKFHVFATLVVTYYFTFCDHVECVCPLLSHHDHDTAALVRKVDTGVPYLDDFLHGVGCFKGKESGTSVFLPPRTANYHVSRAIPAVERVRPTGPAIFEEVSE